MLTLLKQAGRFSLEGLGQLLWPAVCVNCRRIISRAGDILCDNCWSELLACCAGDFCPQCGREVSKYAIVAGRCGDCDSKEFHFAGITRAGIYRDALQRMILTYKKGGSELDTVLGRLADAAFSGSGFYERTEFIVPVPLHFSRRLRRGYNQAALLARRLKRPTGKISADLVRIRRTRSQPAMVTAAARARNVAGAFAVRRNHNFTGSIVCLVDDIKTTGATLNECARALKEAGASEVYAVVLAVAGQRGLK